MGLDGVELVMAVEETFGVNIPDEDAAGLATVGDIYNYVCARRPQNDMADSCLTSAVFYRLRRAMMSVLQTPREAIKPSVPLATLIPRQRRRTWRRLNAAADLVLPKLRRPRWVVYVGIVVGIGLVVAGLSAFPARWRIAHVLWLPVAVGYLLNRITLPLATVFPPDFATLGLLTKAVLAKNFAAVEHGVRQANAQEVWEALRYLVATQLGVLERHITKETDLVRDLNVG